MWGCGRGVERGWGRLKHEETLGAVCVVIEATMRTGREMVGKRVDYALKIN